MMKLANPLYYPVPVLIGAIALVVGVRMARLPSVVVVPVSVAIATAGAAFRKGQEPERYELNNPALEQELQSVRQQAVMVANQANALRDEATKLLTEAHQMELLGTVQYACDRASELPGNIDQMARRLGGADSLLSVSDLKSQLQGVEARLASSTGAARTQWAELANTLQRNIQLAQEGRDARQAQVASLSNLILNAAGVLQQLQNKLRTADLTDTAQALEVRSLSDEFNSVQENLSLLTGSDNGLPSQISS
ncbi:MAG: hypothetical protein VKK04_16135 [Synechococcales bacterium]|nr:hypothetical protein [Synechococcales bacterium]